MLLRTKLASTVGALGLAAAAVYAPAASADRVGFSVSVGGPGYAFNVGNAGYYDYDYWRPAPVVVAPYVPYYRPYYPRPVVVAPPVIYRPYPVYRGYYRHDYRDWDRGRHWDRRHDWRHDGRHDGRHWDR
jgi:hypothetical protein